MSKTSQRKNGKIREKKRDKRKKRPNRNGRKANR